MFIRGDEGGIGLRGAVAAMYRECLDELAKVYSPTPESAISRKAIENLLQLFVLRALRPPRGVDASRSTFERRRDLQLRKLFGDLEAGAATWHVFLGAGGIAEEALPFGFGGVRFVAGREEASAIAATVPEYTGRRGVRAHERKAERAVREQDRREIVEAFSAVVIAKVEVLASDPEAAKRIGLERIRRTIDCINYFAPITHRGPAVRVFAAPDALRHEPRWFVDSAEKDRRAWSVNAWPSDQPLRDRGCLEDKARNYGARRVSRVLAAGDRSELEARIINALSWAGKARVEPRSEQAFLLFHIALEALLTKPETRSGTTERLRFRTAMVVGTSLEHRRELYKLIDRLSDVRGALVHSGDASTLTQDDLYTIAALLETAATRLLVEEPFTKFRSADDLERWFDERMLS